MAPSGKFNFAYKAEESGKSRTANESARGATGRKWRGGKLEHVRQWWATASGDLRGPLCSGEEKKWLARTNLIDESEMINRNSSVEERERERKEAGFVCSMGFVFLRL